MRDLATAPQVGDRCTSANLTLTITGVGPLITWRIEGGTEPRNYNAAPAEFARLTARTLAAGAIFEPSASSAPSAENSVAESQP
jgi:hypothetical protein